MTELTDRTEAATPGAASIARATEVARVATSLDHRTRVHRALHGRSTRAVTPRASQRLRAWLSMIGDFTLSSATSDLMHAGRAELATKPALVYKGKDHRGLKVFDLKSRRKPKDPATLNRYMQAIGGRVHVGIQEQRLAPKGMGTPLPGHETPSRGQRTRAFPGPGRAHRLFESVKASRVPASVRVDPDGHENRRAPWRAAGADLARCRPRCRRGHAGKTKNGDRRTLVLLDDVVEACGPSSRTIRRATCSARCWPSTCAPPASTRPGATRWPGPR
jgi:hypothetical protein